MRSRLIPLILCAALASACATTEPIKGAQGEGSKQIFPQSFMFEIGERLRSRP